MSVFVRIIHTVLNVTLMYIEKTTRSSVGKVVLRNFGTSVDPTLNGSLLSGIFADEVKDPIQGFNVNPCLNYVSPEKDALWNKPLAC